MVTVTTDATTGETTEVTENAAGLTVVFEDYDSAGNWVVYLEGPNDERIMEVHDVRGGITTTTFYADGTSLEVKIDASGNEIIDAGYDDNTGYYYEVYYD